MRAALILLVALLVGETPAMAADVAANDPSGERVSAALVSIAMRRETVRRTTDYCGSTYPAMKTDSAEAFVAWSNRQAGFLTAATSIRDKITQDTAGNPQQAEQWNRFVTGDLPKQVDQLAAAMLQPLTDMPLDDARQHMCADLISNAQSGALDIDKWDPKTAALLRGVAGKNARASPVGANYKPIPADPGERRDAAALIGHWKNMQETLVHYNGLVDTTTPPCTTDFDGARTAYVCGDGEHTVRSVANYKVAGPGHLETTTVENTAVPQSVGRHAVSTFRLEGDTLIVTAYPPTAENAPDESVIKIESMLLRAVKPDSPP
ncbi:MAG TPA: hypothetical protein VGF92_05715 [Stellaceae bacterium]|jgi:hypothetical protein